MRTLLLSFVLLTTLRGVAQSSYSGTLGKHPITLVAYHYNGAYPKAYYAYDTYDTPISVHGRRDNGTLRFFERDLKGDTLATLTFLNFKPENKSITGKWTNADATRTYHITLQKDFEVGDGRCNELLQPESTKAHYFKAILTQDSRVSGIKIVEKTTDRLIQTIALDCQLVSAGNVTVADYNFDGMQDFSVFEASYAGPNTSSIYILRDPKSENYVVSDFSGTSLTFDQELKLVYEHNQCCAGTRHMEATYNIVANKMVLVAKKCTQYDEKKGAFVEVECE